MLHKRFITGFAWIFLLSCTTLSAQELRNPFDFPILLSANFGELRANHFHAGLDFKTQGVEGKPIHAVKEGVISRINVSPWGYGNAIYMDHPDGTTTVYGHLQKYTTSIAQYIKEKQYELESFSVDLKPDSALFIFKRGDVIGYAGNSGSSGGPHLHFEIRDTQTEEIMDPLPFYKDRIKDTRPPVVQGIKIYPVAGEGIVNDSNKDFQVQTATSKSGQLTVTESIKAWGKVGFGIRAIDRMDNTNNIYGIKTVSMSVNGVELFHCDIQRFFFDQTRYINSLIDYNAWRDTHKFFMKTFVEPGNRLPFIDHINRGYLTIEEEGDYEVLFALSDLYGNTTYSSFWIEGVEQAIPPRDSTHTQTFHRLTENIFGAKSIRLNIPRQAFYSDLDFNYQSSIDTGTGQVIHRVHTSFVPLHKSAYLTLRIAEDTLSNKKAYGIVSLFKGKKRWIGGSYNDGWLQADIRELGYSYMVDCDTVPPKITPINQKQWSANKVISFHITDNLSGVSTYRGEINGAYVLFEMDGKRGRIYYKIDKDRLVSGQQNLVLSVKDACGNTTEYTYRFTL